MNMSPFHLFNYDYKVQGSSWKRLICDDKYMGTLAGTCCKVWKHYGIHFGESNHQWIVKRLRSTTIIQNNGCCTAIQLWTFLCLWFQISSNIDCQQIQNSATEIRFLLSEVFYSSVFWHFEKVMFTLPNIMSGTNWQDITNNFQIW